MSLNRTEFEELRDTFISFNRVLHKVMMDIDPGRESKYPELLSACQILEHTFDKCAILSYEREAQAEKEALPKTHDPVHNPSHYTQGGIEVLDFIEAYGLGYHLGNVIKYVARAGKKMPSIYGERQDLEKAKVYLDRYIERLPVYMNVTIVNEEQLNETDIDNVGSTCYNSTGDDKE